MRLKDHVAVVTGAASGMGRALCHELHRAGMRLGMLDRNGEGLAALANELGELSGGGRSAGGGMLSRPGADSILSPERDGPRKHGTQPGAPGGASQSPRHPWAFATADVRDRAAVRQAIDTLTEQLGPVDVLVACAGITGATLVDELAVEETETILEVNLLGVANAIDAVLPGMLARGRGHLVALASLAGCRGVPFSAAYSASKAGLINYLEGLRPALRRRGVAVTTVLPGFVRTPLLQNARVQAPVRPMEPEAAARRIIRAIRRRSRVYAFPWATRLGIAVLGWLPPWLYDWCMVRGAARIPNVPY